MKLNPGSIMVMMVAVLLSSLPLLASAQVKTDCDPTVRTCPANSALSRTANFDFTNGGGGSDWKPQQNGVVNYNSDGAAPTVAKQGDNPNLRSNFYIMFGRVDFVLKAAPGTGIVSTALLASDCQDEIDFEWLGGDNTEVQTNYFRKGNEGGYANGAFHADPENHDTFKTYTIDWNKDRILFQIDGNTIRTVTRAEAGSKYPQTPAYIMVGIWAGGDPANLPGTIEWAGGHTKYADGPFKMQVKSIRATDYSSGSEYQYSDGSCNWQSIKAVDGQVNHQNTGSENLSASDNIVTSSSVAKSSKATVTKVASACHSSTANDDNAGDCSRPNSASTTQASAPSSSTTSAGPSSVTTGAAAKKSQPIGTQALVIASSFWGFLGAIASLF